MATEYLKVIFSTNQGDLDKFNKSLKDADKAAEELDKDLNKMGDNDFHQKLSNGFDNVVKGVKIFLALEVVKEFSQIAIEASKVAAAGEGIRSAFSSLGGTTADLKKMSAAIGGTVDNLKLMEFAVKAMQKGLNIDQITKTLVYLDRQANATGNSFEVLADKAIKSMQDVPAFIEHVDKVTKELEGTVSDTGDAYGRVAASQKNLQEAFGRLVNSDGFKKTQAFFADTLDNITKFLEGKDFGVAGKSVEELNILFDEVLQKRNALAQGASLLESIVGNNADRQTQLKDLNNELDAIFEAIQNARVFESQEGARKKTAEDELAAKKKKNIDDLIAYAEKRDLEYMLNQIKLEEEAAAKKLEIEKKRATDLEDFLAALRETQLNERQAGANLSELTPLADRFAVEDAAAGLKGLLDDVKPEPIDKEVEDLTNDLISKQKGASKFIKDNFDSMLTTTLQITSLFESLTSKESTTTQFFSQIFKAMGVVLSAIPGAQAFGLASSAIGSAFGAFNEGGKIPGFGPDRDSILIAATPGEFITKRSAANRSPLLLDAINAGEIDDRFLKQLNVAPVITVNQDQVVKAIEAMPQIDFYKNGSILYEVKRNALTKNISRKQRISL
jgi:hypothetical protein